MKQSNMAMWYSRRSELTNDGLWNGKKGSDDGKTIVRTPSLPLGDQSSMNAPIRYSLGQKYYSAKGVPE
jgi:hypothetical protein